MARSISKAAVEGYVEGPVVGGGWWVVVVPVVNGWVNMIKIDHG